jgi:hypothetical protein
MIQKINKILIEVRPTEQHIHHQLKWFPENMKEEIRKDYSEHILTVNE